MRRSFFSGFISGLTLGVIFIAGLSIYINLKEAAKVGKEPSVAEDYLLKQSSEPELEAIADQEKVEKQKTTDLSTSTLESFENSKSKEHEGKGRNMQDKEGKAKKGRNRKENGGNIKN